MRVLGMDPSLRNFGFVVAELDVDTLEIEPIRFDVVETESLKKTRKTVRQNSLDLEAARVLVLGARQLQTMGKIGFVEMPVGSKSARAMVSYGICLGVLSNMALPLIQLHPTEVKFAATGDKYASKEDMIEWAVKKWPKAPWLKKGDKILSKNEHLADALASIVAGVRTDDFRSVIEIFRHLTA